MYHMDYFHGNSTAPADLPGVVSYQFPLYPSAEVVMIPDRNKMVSEQMFLGYVRPPEMVPECPSEFYHAQFDPGIHSSNQIPYMYAPVYPGFGSSSYTNSCITYHKPYNNHLFTTGDLSHSTNEAKVFNELSESYSSTDCGVSVSNDLVFDLITCYKEWLKKNSIEILDDVTNQVYEFVAGYKEWLKENSIETLAIGQVKAESDLVIKLQGFENGHDMFDEITVRDKEANSEEEWTNRDEVHNLNDFFYKEQTSTVKKYYDDLISLLPMVRIYSDCLPESLVLDVFIGGLKKEIGEHFEAQRPTSLCEALELAELIEDQIRKEGNMVNGSHFNELTSENERRDNNEVDGVVQAGKCEPERSQSLELLNVFNSDPIIPARNDIENKYVNEFYASKNSRFDGSEVEIMRKSIESKLLQQGDKKAVYVDVRNVLTLDPGGEDSKRELLVMNNMIMSRSISYRNYNVYESQCNAISSELLEHKETPDCSLDMRATGVGNKNVLNFKFSNFSLLNCEEDVYERQIEVVNTIEENETDNGNLGLSNESSEMRIGADKESSVQNHTALTFFEIIDPDGINLTPEVDSGTEAIHFSLPVLEVAVVAKDEMDGDDYSVNGAIGLVKLWTARTNEGVAIYYEHEDMFWTLAIRKKIEMLPMTGGDAVVNLWHDSITADKEKSFWKAERSVLRGHELGYVVYNADFTIVIQIAFKLRKPLEHFSSMALLCSKNDVGHQIAKALCTLEKGAWHLLLEYAREWNVKPKPYRVLQSAFFQIFRIVSLTVKLNDQTASKNGGSEGLCIEGVQRVKTGILKLGAVVTLSFSGQKVKYIEERDPQVDLKLRFTGHALIGESFVLLACADRLRFWKFRPKHKDAGQCKYLELPIFALRNGHVIIYWGTPATYSLADSQKSNEAIWLLFTVWDTFFVVGSSISAKMILVLASLELILSRKNLHSHSLKLRISRDEFLPAALIVIYSRCGGNNDAQSVSDLMPMKTSIECNSIISCYVHHGYNEEILVLYSKMLDPGVRVNFKLSILSSVYERKWERLDGAQNAFEKIAHRNFTWDALIAEYENQDRRMEAVELVKKMALKWCGSVAIVLFDPGGTFIAAATLDVAAKNLNLNFFVVHKRWKNLGILMDARICAVCGIKGFGADLGHTCENDDIWTILAWFFVITYKNKENLNGGELSWIWIKHVDQQRLRTLRQKQLLVGLLLCEDCRSKKNLIVPKDALVLAMLILYLASGAGAMLILYLASGAGSNFVQVLSKYDSVKSWKNATLFAVKYKKSGIFSWLVLLFSYNILVLNVHRLVAFSFQSTLRTRLSKEWGLSQMRGKIVIRLKSKG